MADNHPPAGWYRDPTSPSDGRYWDGTMWTNSVSRAGQTITIPIDTERAALPPVPGSEMPPAVPPVTPSPAPAVTVTSTGSSGPSIAGIIMAVIAAVLVIVLILVLANNNDSNDDQPPANTDVPATEAPSEPATSDGG